MPFIESRPLLYKGKVNIMKNDFVIAEPVRQVIKIGLAGSSRLSFSLKVGSPMRQ